MITEQQINNLHKLPKTDVKILLDTCLDILGTCDIDEAKSALGYKNRSRIYQLMIDKNTATIGSHKFICVNLLIHDKNH